MKRSITASWHSLTIMMYKLSVAGKARVSPIERSIKWLTRSSLPSAPDVEPVNSNAPIRQLPKRAVFLRSTRPSARNAKVTSIPRSALPCARSTAPASPPDLNGVRPWGAIGSDGGLRCRLNPRVSMSKERAEPHLALPRGEVPPAWRPSGLPRKVRQAGGVPALRMRTIPLTSSGRIGFPFRRNSSAPWRARNRACWLTAER